VASRRRGCHPAAEAGRSRKRLDADNAGLVQQHLNLSSPGIDARALIAVVALAMF